MKRSDRKHVRWLYGELPDLVSQDVVDSATAERLCRHYGDPGLQSGKRIALTLFGILGSVLIGAGIILLLAYNWQGLSRGVRTVLSMAPLITAQGLGVWILATGRRSAAWREGVGAFLSLTIGASIALVSQTYHILGDVETFLVIWMLLVLPVIYLLDATVPCVIYLAGITSWSGVELFHDGGHLFYWALLVLAVPYLWRESRHRRYGPRSCVLGWATSLSVCVAAIIMLTDVLEDYWAVVFSVLFGLLYLMGSHGFMDAPSLWHRPHHTLGCAGSVFLAWLFSFGDVWDEAVDYHSWGWHLHEASRAWMLGFVYLMLAAAVVLMVLLVRRKLASRLLIGSFPVVTVVAHCLGTWLNLVWAGVALFNLYVLVIGVGLVLVGIRHHRIGRVNGGMFVMAALIVARFFDYELGFVTRGLSFIVLGTAFLVANIVMVRRMKGAKA